MAQEGQVRSVLKELSERVCRELTLSVARVSAIVFVLLLACLISLLSISGVAEQVPVRHMQGLLHGFLVLRDINGNILASGDVSQTASGTRVTNELVFHFKDGSLHREITVFSQRQRFQLLKYHLVQKGKAFKRSMDMTVDAWTGKVKVVSLDDKSKEELFEEQLTLPSDLANGMIGMLLGDIATGQRETILSMLVATPKPRVVKLVVRPEGEDTFLVDALPRKATRYAMKIVIGGVAGAVAPIAGKQPPDTHAWIIGGRSPAVLKTEGPLCEGGPVWRIELASPVWPTGRQR